MRLRAIGISTVLAFAAALAACEPEAGSERWCESMRETPRGDWSANDAIEFARSCVFEGDE